MKSLTREHIAILKALIGGPVLSPSFDMRKVKALDRRGYVTVEKDWLDIVRITDAGILYLKEHGEWEPLKL